MSKKTEENPRYELKEITVNGFNRTGTFVTKDKIENHFGKTDVYQSYYNYTDEIKEHFKNNNSVGGYPGMIEADNLIIDLDFEPDLNAVHSIVKKLIQNIESKYQTKSYRVYFSGNKGFHIEIPTFLFGEFNKPSIALHSLHKEMAKAIVKPILSYIEKIEDEYKESSGKEKAIFDLTIYDKARLMRVLNTKNSKSGLFKIRLKREELFAYDIEQIKELAKDQRDEIRDDFEEKSNGALTDLYYNSAKSVVIPTNNFSNSSTSFALGVDKIQSIHISGYEVIRKNCKWLDDLFKKEHISHEERTQLAQLFLFFGSDGAKMLHEILAKSDNYNEAITNYHINKMARKEFKAPKCEKICDKYPCPALSALNKNSCVAFSCVSKLSTFNETFITERFLDRHPHLMYSLVDESFYDYSKGVYKLYTETDLKSILNTFMLLNMKETQVKKNLVNDVYERLKIIDRSIYRDKLNQDYGKINLLNGIYDLRGKKLIDHTPSLRHSIQLRFNYDENAKAPRFEKFLNDITDGNEEKKDYLLKTMCYCLLPDYSYQKVFVFYGNGRNGKSVLTNLITELLGEKNVSSMSIHSLAKDRFALVNLYNKLVNISSEIAQDDLSLETIKKLSGNDTIMAEVKYKDFVFFKNIAKLIINANQLPRFSELNKAVRERFVLVNFPRSFTKEEANPNLFNELKEELPGIFNLVVSKYDEIVGRGGGIYYSTPKSILDEQRILQKETSTVMEFIEEECVFSKIHNVSLSDLHKKYSEFCRNSGYRSLGIKNFRKALESDERVTIDRASFGTRVNGISLGRIFPIYQADREEQSKAFAA